ncbi:MAG TPA: hypothetical protein VHY08_21605 [Bacillota bacterium]|nr:hypothetical protein [Bacillota bacterium]
MKKVMALVQSFFTDRDMYQGIFAEIAYVIVLGMIGFLICWALQRWV